ncbi:sensor histidine kinase [Dactylosporangium sp. CA-052675]|uniref:sensor histidine kinase n=1 Tax=Dactylosporangium sp. CA-052675 TaxID=3239927 RepID=UPI003D8CE1B2
MDLVAVVVVVAGFWALPGGLAGLALGAVAGLAMLLRRRAPVTAVVVAAAVTAAGWVLGLGEDPMLAAAWCLYPVAAHRAGQAGGLAIGVVGGLAVLGATVAVPEGDARAAGQRVLLSAVVLAGSWLLGTAAGRQARAAEAVERARVQAAVARDVHDVVGHALAVISAQAGVARLLPDADAAELRQSLGDVEEHARGALEEVQHLVRTLRDLPAPVAPARERLLAVIAASRAAGLTVHERIDGDLPDPGGTVAVRVVQESLGNALRHAPGSVCTVDVHATPAEAVVDVHSTAPPRPVPAGAPMAGPAPVPVPVPAPGTGVGLAGLRERVGLAGGELSWSAPGDGEFRVSARVPL